MYLSPWQPACSSALHTCWIVMATERWKVPAKIKMASTRHPMCTFHSGQLGMVATQSLAKHPIFVNLSYNHSKHLTKWLTWRVNSRKVLTVSNATHDNRIVSNTFSAKLGLVQTNPTLSTTRTANTTAMRLSQQIRTFCQRSLHPTPDRQPTNWQ